MKIHIHIRGDGVLCAHTTLENDEKLVETIRDLHEDYENADCVLEGFTEGNIVITSTDEEDNVLYCEYRDANDFVEFDETAGLSEGEIDVRISRREQGVWFEDDIDIGDEPFDIERLRLEGSQIPGFAAVVTNVYYGNSPVERVEDIGFDAGMTLTCIHVDEDGEESEFDPPDWKKQDDAAPKEEKPKVAQPKEAEKARQAPVPAAEFFGNAEKGPRAATFKEAWSAFWRSMGFRLAGRATRSEYWKGVLLLLVSWVVLVVLSGFLTSVFHRPAAWLSTFALGLFTLAQAVPSYTAQIRRLHDTNRSGWWLLLYLVPYVGALALLVLFCLPGTSGSNKYGQCPYTK